MYNPVEKEFFNKARLWGNTLLFSASDAIEFIKRCRQLDIRILGIDAFKPIDDAIQPSMEHSIDFSLKKRQRSGNEDTWSAAEEFVKERTTLGFIFEIVCE